MSDLIGRDYIKEFTKNLTQSPGVYQMMDVNGKHLYVGKAKNLKNRVSSYAAKAALPNRTLVMIGKIKHIEVITTSSEAEALLLEASLIKKFSPPYNILLKDDKSYPFIEFTNHEFPQIRKHRGKQNKKNKYFGPFASVGAMNQTLELLQKAFLLRPCSDSVFRNRSRPCLQYQIKRCSAPCVNLIEMEEYKALVLQARDFLSGKNSAIQQKLAEEMQALSQNMNYEKAAIYRDRIKALTQVQQEQSLNVSGVVNADIFGVYLQGGKACVQVFFFRGGQAFGSRTFYPKISNITTEAEIISTSLSQFYQKHIAPPQILISHIIEDKDILSEALSLSANQNVKITKPERGEKQKLVKHVIDNAKNSLMLHMADNTQIKKSLEEIEKIFALPEMPKRIEVYDNSHISGNNSVGAMVVATPDGFDKKSYRKFSFKDEDIDKRDDYAMMRSVMKRRLTKLAEESAENKSNDTSSIRPDLMLIDGGKGQLSATREIMEELGIYDIPYVAISKGPDRNAGREQFHLPDKTPFHLPPDNPTLYYLQKLRDEAHRFAISSHRKKRSSNLENSYLEDIPGIGSARKKALLNHFGSAQAVKDATIEELKRVEGISNNTAKLISGYFKS